jgi:hypothetical protein
MNIYKYFGSLFKKLKMRGKMWEFYDIINLNKEILTKFVPKNMVQYGGSKKIKFKSSNKTFTIYQEEDSENISFNIYNKNDENSTFVCAFFIINKEEKMVYINGISSYPHCVEEGLPKTKGGSLILKAVLEFIDLIKNKYKLKYIQLRDTSHFKCAKSGNSIPMSTLYMLTRGSTWYYKYGFVPYNIKKNSIDIEKLVALKTNQNLVNLIPIKCTNIYNIILTEFHKLNYNSENKKILLEIVNKYKNISIKEFMHFFMTNYDEMCIIFEKIYPHIMKDINLTDLQNTIYYKIL